MARLRRLLRLERVISKMDFCSKRPLQSFHRIQFTTGQANHDFVAFFNHIEVSNRPSGFATQSFLKFVVLEFIFT